MNDYFTGLINTLGYIQNDVILEIIRVLHEARLNRRSILIMGNGGSASTASHFVADLSKNTFNGNFPSFRAIGLADNMAIFSAYANDESYECVFSRQVDNLANPGDVVIAISASGNSMNVVRALEAANRIGATTIGFTGFTGGKVSKLVDIHLHVPSTIIEQVEDIHLMLEHMICKNLRENVNEITGLMNLSLALDDDLIKLRSTQQTSTEIVAFQLLQNLSGGFDGPYHLPELLRLCLQLSLEGTGADSGSIIIMDGSGSMVDAAVAYDQQILVPNSQEMMDYIECGLAGWVFHNRQAALVENTRDDPRWLKRTWDEASAQPRSAISVPLLGQEGVSGVLTLANSNSSQFSQGHLVLLLAFSTLISYSKKSLF